MLGFVLFKLISHPHLYPRFAFDTPVEEYLSHRVGKILGVAENRIELDGFRQQSPGRLMPNRRSPSLRRALSTPPTPFQILPGADPPRGHPPYSALVLWHRVTKYSAQTICIWQRCHTPLIKKA